MFAIEEEKLPPPTPAVAEQASRTQNVVSWSCAASHPLGTTNASSADGTSSSAADITVHNRPPRRGTANVYGIRIAEPTRLGTETSQNDSDTLIGSPAAGRLSTTTDHSTQIAKPRCSVNTEKIRLRRATRRPVVSQNSSSSGFQCSIQPRPRRAAAVVSLMRVSLSAWS